jgi:hypothetical protein
MSQADLIIRNGTIIDGSGGPEIVSDILIKDGLLKRLGILIIAIIQKKKLMLVVSLLPLVLLIYILIMMVRLHGIIICHHHLGME